MKIERIKNPLAQAESIMSRVLVKSLISHYYLKKSILDYKTIEIINQSEGKQIGSPIIYVEDKKIPLEITMTHSYGTIGVWLCTERIGIDNERIFLKKESSFIRDVFTSTERERLRCVYPDQSLEKGFTILWCIKESLAKLLKCGLQFNPRRIQVLMNENQTVDIHIDQQLGIYFHLFSNKNLRLNVAVYDNFCMCKSILL